MGAKVCTDRGRDVKRVDGMSYAVYRRERSKGKDERFGFLAFGFGFGFDLGTWMGTIEGEGTGLMGGDLCRVPD
jgi:hypothetical protein